MSKNVAPKGVACCKWVKMVRSLGI
jgi:hypothetical protein